jgi:alkylation response protein AidB-like acyl-CoA dehydrogenase
MSTHDVPAPVTLGPDIPSNGGVLIATIIDTPPHNVSQALALARILGVKAAVPGTGSTRELWEAMATVAAFDLGAVRAMEPHLDALAILDQAGETALIDDRLWAVYAAEAPGVGLVFDSGEVTGTKAWCSLASAVDAALVTARNSDGSRGLFAVDLGHPGVRVEDGAWHSRGLVEIPSGPVSFSGVPATAIGEGDWYLTRPGFSWGAIGVAACWYGGAVGIARTLRAAAESKPDDPILLMHLGAVDGLLHSARTTLREAADQVDGGSATGETGKVLAKRVRATVARSCEDIIVRAGHALGPAALALDETHAKRIADLTVYIRQHHAERDEMSLGRAVAQQDHAPW